MVFEERPADNPRKTHRHHRGEYLSPREEVTPGVLKMFPPLPEDGPANRLTFARWLVSERNPLASRVAVNRAWRAFFGNGLARTNGDYGTQSDPPTHPELLDWLSCEFMERGWSLKKLHRMIVLSATYRQSSVITPDRLSADPENLWLSRGPRHQVEAEMVRDILLKASGLLSPKSGRAERLSAAARERHGFGLWQHALESVERGGPLSEVALYLQQTHRAVRGVCGVQWADGRKLHRQAGPKHYAAAGPHAAQ